jgi:uncharacterized ferritin-like protein (DUF455 family)
VSSQPAIDPRVFGEAPARDDRFVVKERWVECDNLPEQHPHFAIQFFHRQMNEEINGLENAARNLADFPDAPWELRMWLARQCSDEARHVLMFRRIYEARGGRVGQFPVLNFQYRIVARLNDLLGRLAVQNRSFEAGGIDAVRFAIEEAHKAGDTELAELFEAQQADEILHVRFANEWIRDEIQKHPAKGLVLARALNDAARAFHFVMGTEGTSNVRYTVDAEGRLDAGFDAEEIKAAAGATQRNNAAPGAG